MNPLPVRIVNTAAQSIEEAAIWWEKNRPKAPNAFVVDLENALKLIALYPDIGALALNIRLSGVRRISLTRVRYHLYYRVTHEPVVEVLALWHTSRADSPRL